MKNEVMRKAKAIFFIATKGQAARAITIMNVVITKASFLPEVTLVLYTGARATVIMVMILKDVITVTSIELPIVARVSPTII